MEPYARKSQTWDLYFDALRFQIDLCTYEEQYELAINEANLMYERAQKVNCARGLIGAKQCLGNVYISTERWDEGMKALEAAYQLSLQTDNAVVRISILCQLISITKDQKNNQLLSEYLAKLKKHCITIPPRTRCSKRHFMMFTCSAKYITPIIIYMHTSRNKHIKIWLTRANFSMATPSFSTGCSITMPMQHTSGLAKRMTGHLPR